MSKQNKQTDIGKTITSLILVIWSTVLFIHAQDDFTANPQYGCDTLTVQFKFLPTNPSYPPTSLLWDFGNDSASSDTNPIVFYDRPGRYTVIVIVNGTDTIPKPGFIFVNRTPPAGFTVNGSPTALESSFTAALEPIDTTRGKRTYEWRINNNTASTQPEYIYTFPAAGSYDVMLIVRDSICVNRSQKTITVSDILAIPNVFYPDVTTQGNTDRYKNFIIQSNGLDPVSIQIFARTGALVYKAKAPIINWDGRSSSGHELPTGVYYYIVEYDIQPMKQVKTGFVHLYRDVP